MTPGQVISFSRFVAVSAKYVLQRTSDGICMSTADATRGYRRAVGCRANKSDQRSHGNSSCP